MSRLDTGSSTVFDDVFTREVKGTLYAFVAVIFRGLWIIMAYYLENYLNATVGQVFFSVEFGSLLFFIIFVLSVESLRIRLYHFVSSVLENDTQCIEELKVVIFRGILSNFGALFILISELYLTPGDVASLYAIAKVLTGFILSHFVLKQTPNKLSIFIILPLSIVGIILICQPNFIFKNNGNNISYFGVIFAICSGIFRSSVNLISNDYNNIHWVIVNIVSQLIGSTLSTIVLIIELFYFNANIFDKENNVIYYLTLVSICIAQLVLIITRTISFQLGNFVRLVMFISTIDILLCYLLQYLIFNEVLNYITIIGIVCIVISVTMIHFQIHKLKNDSNNTTTNNYQQIHQTSDAQQIEG